MEGLPAELRRTLAHHLNRVRDMAGLYDNWPMALADRVSIKKRQGLAVYRLRGQGDEGMTLLAERNGADVRVINEMWLVKPYLRHAPDAFRSPVCVVDIGANRGYFALFIASRFGDLRLFCFEPERGNFNLLRANLSLNGVEAVELLRVAVTSDQENTKTLWLGNEPGLHTLVSPDAAPASSGRYTGQVEVVDAVNIVPALRSVQAREGHVDILKLDTEGTEVELLTATAGPGLLTAVRYITAEVGYDQEARCLREKVENLGFETWLEPPYFYALNRRVDDWSDAI
jgi:FkbM family methyltransferase